MPRKFNSDDRILILDPMLATGKTFFGFNCSALQRPVNSTFAYFLGTATFFHCLSAPDSVNLLYQSNADSSLALLSRETPAHLTVQSRPDWQNLCQGESKEYM